MKILYLSGSYVPSRRASSIHVMHMCQAMAHLGHEVTLVTKDNRESIEPDISDDYDYYGIEAVFSIKKLPRPKGWGGGGRFTWEMSRLLSTFDSVDTLVYSRELFGAWIAVRKGFRVVFEAHDLPATWLSRHLHKQLFAAWTFSRFVVISQALRDLFAEGNLLPARDKVFVAHDAAEPISTSTDSANGLFQDKGKTRLGYLGHLYPGRGIDILLEIASRLESCEFHIIGGTNKDLAYWQYNHVPQNVFFHGFIQPGKLPDFFSAFDILLMPYQKSVSVAVGGTDTARWMSPLKMFEYMSTGKPIISSDLPVLREVLAHEKNALLVPPDDADAWEAAVRRLQSNPALAARLGECAREDLVQNYTWQARAEKVLRDLTLHG